MAAWKASETPLSRLIPGSISQDATIATAADALDPRLGDLFRDIQQVRIYSRIDQLSEEALDLLGWQFHVDFWSPTLPADSKRALVHGSIAWHRRKGTAWAVRKLLGDLGVNAQIIQWHDPEGAGLDKFTFAVRGVIHRPLLPTEMWGEATIGELERAIDAAKNTRSWLAWLSLALMIETPFSALGLGADAKVADQSRTEAAFHPFFDLARLDQDALDGSGLDQFPVARDSAFASVLLGRPWSLDMMMPEGGAIGMDIMAPGVEGDAVPPIDVARLSAITSGAAVTASLDAAATCLPATLIPAEAGLDSNTISNRTAEALWGMDMVGLDESPGIDDVPLDMCPLDALMEVTHA